MVHARLHDPIGYDHNHFPGGTEGGSPMFGSVQVECDSGSVTVFYHTAAQVRAHLAELEKLAEKMEADDE